MADARSSQNIKDFVLPIGMVVSLAMAALSVGQTIGRMTEKVGRLEEVVAELGKSSAPAERMRVEIELRTAINTLADQQAELNRRVQLLSDFTRGRISHLPYHAPRGDQ